MGWGLAEMDLGLVGAQLGAGSEWQRWQIFFATREGDFGPTGPRDSSSSTHQSDWDPTMVNISATPCTPAASDLPNLHAPYVKLSSTETIRLILLAAKTIQLRAKQHDLATFLRRNWYKKGKTTAIERSATELYVPRKHAT